jgi:hypothetical protein
VTTDEIYRKMTILYGDNCMNQGIVYGWVERFKGGRTSVAGDARCGQTIATCVEVHAYETSTTPGRKWRMDGLRPNRNILYLTESGNALKNGAIT